MSTGDPLLQMVNVKELSRMKTMHALHKDDGVLAE